MAAELLQPVCRLAQHAGQAILEVYDSDFSVTHKEDSSPLTQADLVSHQIIVDGLKQLTPALPVLSEESAQLPFDTRSAWRQYWLVDPLDGTREFVKRNGEFTVNIALVRAHEVVLGVVYAPVSGDLYYAERGSGAHWLNGHDEAQLIRCRSIPSGPLAVAGSRSHPGERLRGYLERLGEHNLISLGSSLKLCLVAHGRADLYVRLGLTSEWDTAAAQCVVEEAGGQVTDTTMQRLCYNTKDSLLNPEFFVFGDSSVDWSQYLESNS